jgi:hypothetical protein
VYLLPITDAAQRIEREGRVAHPGVAVVVVAVAADPFWQRGRRRGEDRARLGVDQQLEGEQAAGDRFRPEAVI